MSNAAHLDNVQVGTQQDPGVGGCPSPVLPVRLANGSIRHKHGLAWPKCLVGD